MGLRKEYHNSTQSLNVDSKLLANQQSNGNGTSSNTNSNMASKRESQSNAHAAQMNEDEIGDLPSIGGRSMNNHNQKSQSTMDLRNDANSLNRSLPQRSFHKSTQSLHGKNVADRPKSNEQQTNDQSRKFRPRQARHFNNNNKSSSVIIFSILNIRK